MRPSKNRLVQVAKAGKRKLFGKERRGVFLEWFAATCNVRLSAGKAGVHEKTVYKHRMKDEAFAEAWDRALQQGYARLEARLLEEVHSPHPPTASRRAPPSPAASRGEGLEVRVGLDDPEIEERFDPQLAIVLLREHARRLPGSPDKRKHFRTTARVASNAEIAAALAKRLKTFAVRVSREETDPHPDPLPQAGEGEA